MAQPPHVASPARLLAHEVAARRRQLRNVRVPIACEGGDHALRFDGGRLFADDHDEETEAVVHALGGAVPACLRIVDELDEATPAELWAALEARESGASSGLPEDVLRVLLAAALDAEFADASTVVRDAVAPLGLALLGSPPRSTALLRTKFQATRQFPHWPLGGDDWSDVDLTLLTRYLRHAPGEDGPHLVTIPIDPAGRRAVARYLATRLEGGRTMSLADLKGALSPTHRNVRVLIALLVAEGFVEHAERDAYRVGRRRPKATAGSRRTTRR